MSGPRITTGKNSKQDYRTPQDFLTAAEKRFGPIMFDLAAHANNHVHRDYFAPAEFTERLELGSLTTDIIMAMADSLRARGVSATDSNGFALKAIEDNAVHHVGAPKANQMREYTLKNSDTAARAFDSLAQPWHKLKGLLWLNCEFGDIGRWAKKCAVESALGAEILLLTTLSIGGTKWSRNSVCPNADINPLDGRLCFDGVHSFPKDCMISHFNDNNPNPKSISIWEWKTDKIHSAWDARRKLS